MIIEQILVTHMAVFCYLVADEKTKEGVLIDPAGRVAHHWKRVSAKGHAAKVREKLEGLRG